MRLTRYEVISFLVTAIVFGSLLSYFIGWPNLSYSMGSGDENGTVTTKEHIRHAQAIDNLNGVNVYYNGNVATVTGRNVTSDGYNLGLKYQCVEFIKRYYYEYYDHKMADSYGHAKDFFDPIIGDGLMNTSRNLRQFTNGSISRPRTGDILILGPTDYNKYGHIGIVSKSGRNKIELIHQNAGKGNSARTIYKMQRNGGKWYVHNSHVLGWLRKS